MSDSDDAMGQWARMVENMNDAMTESVEQSLDAQARFMEAWADSLEGSMPEGEELDEAFASYGRAYEVWMDAADQLYDRAAAAAEGEDVSVTEFRDIWLQSANEAFKEVMGTSAFAAATGSSVEQLLEMREEAAEVSEDTVAEMGLPTRSDVEEVGERLVELERRQHEVEAKLDRVLDALEE